jgi:hypothetical protein
VNERERFGFTVEKITEGLDDSDMWGSVDPPEWRISLPHKCGRWDIAEVEEPSRGVSQAEAIAELERFLAEGHAALDRLRDEALHIVPPTSAFHSVLMWVCDKS